MATALILIRDVEELGITAAENHGKYYDISVCNYGEYYALALNAFAETPCLWSELIDFTSNDDLSIKVNKIEENYINGIYNDFM